MISSCPTQSQISQHTKEIYTPENKIIDQNTSEENQKPTIIFIVCDDLQKLQEQLLLLMQRNTELATQNDKTTHSALPIELYLTMLNS